MAFGPGGRLDDDVVPLAPFTAGTWETLAAIVLGVPALDVVERHRIGEGVVELHQLGMPDQRARRVFGKLVGVVQLELVTASANCLCQASKCSSPRSFSLFIAR